MKKLGWSLAVIFLFGFYSLAERKTTQTPTYISPLSTANPTPGNNLTINTYKDGQYTGDVVDAFYGNVQVQTTIKGGKITEVNFLQYPNDRERSIAINSQAMPILKQEAIRAQSAQVDIVSGATATSQAFRESLASSLTLAKI